MRPSAFTALLACRDAIAADLPPKPARPTPPASASPPAVPERGLLGVDGWLPGLLGARGRRRRVMLERRHCLGACRKSGAVDAPLKAHSNRLRSDKPCCRAADKSTPARRPCA